MMLSACTPKSPQNLTSLDGWDTSAWKKHSLTYNTYNGGGDAEIAPAMWGAVEAQFKPLALESRLPLTQDTVLYNVGGEPPVNSLVPSGIGKKKQFAI